MLITFLFIVFIVFLSIIIEIRTKQKKRVIVASSGLYGFVLYLVIFDTFKDSSVLIWFIKMRPDLMIESIAPNLLKVFTTNIFLENQFLAKILNTLGIKEGTKLFNIIKNYRPIASTSPLSGISFNSILSYMSNAINDFFGWTSYADYCTTIRKIVYIFVLILCTEVEKAKFVVKRIKYSYISNMLVA